MYDIVEWYQLFFKTRLNNLYCRFSYINPYPLTLQPLCSHAGCRGSIEWVEDDLTLVG